MTKFFVAFCILALVAAFAGNIPAVAHVTISEPCLIAGNLFQPGEYRVMIGDAKSHLQPQPSHTHGAPRRSNPSRRKSKAPEIRTETKGYPDHRPVDLSRWQQKSASSLDAAAPRAS